jgi:predicted molibdopterin-dependent oxidoreductase YjgC
VAALASPFASNEDLAELRRLLDALGVALRGVAVRRGEADALLVKAEKAPNGAGARAAGFGEAAPVVEAIRGGAVRALLVSGHDVLELLEPAELARLEHVVLLDTHRSALERAAHVVLPVRHAAEKAGTFTNHAGRVQRFEAAVEPAWEALSEGEVFARLCSSR